jgi:hypothetical protein
MVEHADRLAAFKHDLYQLKPRQIVQKHITFGETAALTSAQHFALRCAIGEHFAVHPHAVVVVGSAKLGFSIKPARRYGLFGDTSDIDVAIVSAELFARHWRALLDFVDAGGYWEKLPRFQAKFFDGWIRPDLLPPSRIHQSTSEWWEFFRALTMSREFGPYKVSAGIYFDWHCLERYQIRAVAQCKDEVSVS